MHFSLFFFVGSHFRDPGILIILLNAASLLFLVLNHNIFGLHALKIRQVVHLELEAYFCATLLFLGILKVFSSSQYRIKSDP